MDMRSLRTAVVALLVIGIGTPAVAGDLAASVAKAAEQQALPPARSSASKAPIVLGAAMFIGGMATGLYAFINDKNGPYAEFGEATSSNKPLGAAGLGIAFAGGALIFLGTRAAKHAPAIAVAPGTVKVSKQLSW
jgi:hypothetical protein